MLRKMNIVYYELQFSIETSLLLYTLPFQIRGKLIQRINR